MESEGFVYFVKDAEGNVKIGWSVAPEGRIADLQTAQAKPLTVLGVMPAERAVEAELHRAFASLHVRGEWFRGDAGLLSAVAWMCERERRWQIDRLCRERIRGFYEATAKFYDELLMSLPGLVVEYPRLVVLRVRLLGTIREALAMCNGMNAVADEERREHFESLCPGVGPLVAEERLVAVAKRAQERQEALLARLEASNAAVDAAYPAEGLPRGDDA